MARHKSIISVEHDAGQEARVVLGPPDDQSWFRLFRGIVRNGTWADMGPAARSVLVVLAEAVNDQLRRESGQWLAWPSVPTIARRAGLAERNVYVALRELESKRLIRKVAPGGGRRQTTYELQAPTAIEPADGPKAPLTTASSLMKPTGVIASSAVPRSPRQGSPAVGVSQQRKSISRSNDNSASPPPETPVRTALRDAGVAEPTLSRLVDGHDEAALLLRIEDWKNRRAAGAKLGAAWLIASIHHGYELHETTVRRRDQLARASAVADRRRLDAQAESAEALRQRAIETQATALFDAMSDDELDHWKGVVVAEFPTLIRNADRADPREHDRLRRLILGKLACLLGPQKSAE